MWILIFIFIKILCLFPTFIVQDLVFAWDQTYFYMYSIFMQIVIYLIRLLLLFLMHVTISNKVFIIIIIIYIEIDICEKVKNFIKFYIWAHFEYVANGFWLRFA